ncbi:MAG: hypothetical protein WCS98_01435 [Bacillota bacterium]|jgi:23S rRNA (pseudouridine1915-N3)-methyltransferase
MEAISEYRKRLDRYCKADLVHVKNPSQLAKMLSEKYYKIAVTPKGQPISSERLAEMKLINQRNALSADD